MSGINNRCYILIVRMVSSISSFQYIQPFPSMICSAYGEVKNLRRKKEFNFKTLFYNCEALTN